MAQVTECDAAIADGKELALAPVTSIPSEKKSSVEEKPPVAGANTDLEHDVTGKEKPGQHHEEEEEDHDYPNNARLALIILGICFSVFLVALVS
jgi:hypothetical protein